METDQSASKDPRELDARQGMELRKLKAEVDQLEGRHTWREVRAWLSTLASILALGAIFLAILQYYSEKDRFEKTIHQQTDQLQKNIAARMEELKTAYDNGLKQLSVQFDKTNESRYWEKNLQLCSDIVESAGRMSLGAGPKAKDTFDQMLYGRTAMLQDFRDSPLRNTMEEYSIRLGSTRCRTAKCSEQFQYCIEAMACECRDLLCRAGMTLPGCGRSGHNLDCSRYDARCRGDSKEGLQ